MTSNSQTASTAPAERWFVYILQCKDNSFYTGVTTDPDRRLKQHNSLQGGARYTRVRQPVRLVYTESVKDRSAACKREYQIKQLSRNAKEALISPANKRPNRK